MDDNSELQNAAETIAEALRGISHGGLSGPTGLEGVAMALMNGIGGQNGVGDALVMIAESLRDIADAIRETKQK